MGKYPLECNDVRAKKDSKKRCLPGPDLPRGAVRPGVAPGRQGAVRVPADDLAASEQPAAESGDSRHQQMAPVPERRDGRRRKPRLQVDPGFVAVHRLDAESGPVEDRLGLQAVVYDPDDHLDMALRL